MSACLWLGLSPVARKQTTSALPLKSVSLTVCPGPILNEKRGAGVAMRTSLVGTSFVAPNARPNIRITSNSTTKPTANEIVSRLNHAFDLPFIIRVSATPLTTPNEKSFESHYYSTPTRRASAAFRRANRPQCPNHTRLDVQSRLDVENWMSSVGR